MGKKVLESVSIFVKVNGKPYILLLTGSHSL